MKTRLPWVLVVALLIGIGLLFAFNRKQASEIGILQAENQQFQQAQASTDETAKTQSAAKDEELTRLRKDNEDLLRLRNEIRQLKDENQGLNKQVQTAQTQAQNAQAQAEGAQAQVAVLRQNVAQAQATQLATDAAFRARYGVAANASDQEKATACINNLRQIEGAKQQWALEHAKPPNAVPTEVDLRPYLKNNMPACASGGTYTLNAVNIPPACSTPGHHL